MRKFERVSVVLKTYRIGHSEVKIHHRTDNNDVVQAWLYRDGVLADTILSIDRNREAKIVEWFFSS